MPKPAMPDPNETQKSAVENTPKQASDDSQPSIRPLSDDDLGQVAGGYAQREQAKKVGG